MRSALLITLLAGGCEHEVGGDRRHSEELRRETDVRVISPASGDTVESPFTLTYEAGADVASVRLEESGGMVIHTSSLRGDWGSFTVELEPGTWRLSLVGEDGRQEEISRHTLSLRVVPPGRSWVTIVSPEDGEEVFNPVVFLTDASYDVEEVEILADDWSLGTVAPGDLLTWDFSGTGYPREIQARGLMDGELVATHEITITATDGTNPAASEFNALAMDLLRTYPTDGTHDYLRDDSYSGTTRDIWYLDSLVAQGDPEGHCHCVGITWELFMRTFQEVVWEGDYGHHINGMAVSALQSFRTDWYVRDYWGAGVVDAVENYGIGQRITDLEDLEPGDMVQFWRNSASGHSVVFLGWERSGDGGISGVRYWSCQGSTDGIGEVTEYFSAGSSGLVPARFHAARIYMPEAWLPW